MSDKAHWLRRYTVRDGRYPWMADPFLLSVGGDLWSVATDVRSLIAVRDGGVSGRHPCPTEYAGRLRQFFEPLQPDSASRQTTLDDLWAFLGEYRRTPCPECRHDFFDPEREVCALCDNERWLDGDDPPRLVAIDGSLFDADRLVRWLPWELRAEYGPDVRYLVTPGETKRGRRPGLRKALILDGGDWRVVIMAVNPFAADRLVGPAPEYVPCVGAFGCPWRYDEVTAAVASDWRAEQ